MGKLTRLFGVFVTNDFGFVAILVGLVLLIGPLVIAFLFFRNQHPLSGASILGLWILAAAVCVRNFRRQRLSWLSGFLAVLWFIATFLFWCGFPKL
jgi:hypothetical protein